MKNFYKKIMVLIVAVLILCNLSGCNATELEERCFPMVIGVGYDEDFHMVSYVASFPKSNNEKLGEALLNAFSEAETTGVTFEESKSKYETRLSKSVDYNHLKVLVLEENFLVKSNLYNEMLDYLAQSEEFPRNTYVCVVENFDDLAELEKNISQDLGTYLEDYFNTREEKEQQIVSLGDLIDEKENNELQLSIPVLDVEDYYVDWERNYDIHE